MHALAPEIPLPPLVRRRLDRRADAFLSGDRPIDFTQPAGEPALIGPDSISWRVFKNPVALFIGGVAAVILELAEPRVRTGVWDHTSFRTDPVKRLQRTGMAAMVTVYGARSRAEAMIAGVVRAHDRVRGVTPEGQPYHANDPDLLDWVQATAGWGFVSAYDRFVRPLTGEQLDRLFAEGAPAARLYGAVGAPASQAEMDALFARMDPLLVPHPIIDEFLDIMRRAPIAPWGARPGQKVLIRAAVDLVPPRLRARLGLERQGLRPWERPLVKAAGAATDRLRLDSSPAVQACRRLGLPDDHLYR